MDRYRLSTERWRTPDDDKHEDKGWEDHLPFFKSLGTSAQSEQVERRGLHYLLMNLAVGDPERERGRGSVHADFFS